VKQMGYEPYRPLNRPCLACSGENSECTVCEGRGSYIPVFCRLAGILVEEGGDVVGLPNQWRWWEFEYDHMTRGWGFSVREGDSLRAILGFRVVPSDHLVWETWCWLSRDPISERNEFQGSDFVTTMRRTLGEVRKQSPRAWAYFMGKPDPVRDWTDRLGMVV